MNTGVVIPDHFQVTFEEQVIRHVEARHGRVELDIRFRDILPEQIRRVPRLRQMRLDAVQSLKQSVQRFLVGFLRGREPGAVHPVVDGRVYPLIHGVDLGAQVQRVEPPASRGRMVCFAQALRQEGVELGEEHADDLAALVVYDCLVLLIPEDGDGDPAFVGGVCAQVELFQGLAAVDGVLGCSPESAGEVPAIRAALGVQEDPLDYRVEALELMDDVCPMRPGAAEVDVEDVAVLLWRERGVCCAGDGGAEGALRPLEVAVFANY